LGGKKSAKLHHLPTTAKGRGERRGINFLEKRGGHKNDWARKPFKKVSGSIKRTKKQLGWEGGKLKGSYQNRPTLTKEKTGGKNGEQQGG